MLEQKKKGIRLFKYEVFWFKDVECKEIVRSCWGKTCEGGWLDKWQRKINACPNQLLNWSKMKFRQRGLQIEALVQQLDDLQMNWKDNLEQIKSLSIHIDQLWE